MPSLPAALRRALSALALAGVAASSAAQQPVRCTGPGYDDFDFWVGEWTVQWRTADGRDAHGINRIRRTLDGCVIVEEFDGTPGGPLKGISVSVYDARRKVWKQTWVDNQASYLDFEGGRVEDANQRLVLSRTTVVNDQPIQQRMVFRDVSANALTWDWQRSRDGGARWETQWTIRYSRR
jgi:hypothetical protein